MGKYIRWIYCEWWWQNESKQNKRVHIVYMYCTWQSVQLIYPVLRPIDWIGNFDLLKTIHPHKWTFPSLRSIKVKLLSCFFGVSLNEPLNKQLIWDGMPLIYCRRGQIPFLRTLKKMLIEYLNEHILTHKLPLKQLVSAAFVDKGVPCLHKSCLDMSTTIFTELWFEICLISFWNNSICNRSNHA